MDISIHELEKLMKNSTKKILSDDWIIPVPLTIKEKEILAITIQSAGLEIIESEWALNYQEGRYVRYGTQMGGLVGLDSIRPHPGVRKVSYDEVMKELIEKIKELSND